MKYFGLSEHARKHPLGNQGRTPIIVIENLHKVSLCFLDFDMFLQRRPVQYVYLWLIVFIDNDMVTILRNTFKFSKHSHFITWLKTERGVLNLSKCKSIHLLKLNQIKQHLQFKKIAEDTYINSNS